nr:MAG TPA: hypothetical protein [Caudoviricetes sp.]
MHSPLREGAYPDAHRLRKRRRSGSFAVTSKKP